MKYWSLCALEVDKKTIKIENKFQALGETNDIGIWDDMADMTDSEDEDDGGGIGKDIKDFQEIEFKQKAKKKVRFEKMVKCISQKDRRQGMQQPREREINIVEGQGKKSKITIDSGAEESVWPIDQVNEEDLVETEASRNDIGFVAANGARMKNFGALKVDFRKGGKPMSMNFHATNVKKPLAAVCRITECGNKVCFGPQPEDNYIMNVQTNEVILMKRDRGTYVLEVDLNTSSVFTGPR